MRLTIICLSRIVMRFYNIFIYSSWIHLTCIKSYCVIGGGGRGIYAGIQPVPFLSFCLSNSLFSCWKRLYDISAPWREGSPGVHPDILQHTRAFRYRRKLRMTDRHQRGILRGVLTTNSCFVLCKTLVYLAHLLSIIMMVITVLLSG